LEVGIVEIGEHIEMNLVVSETSLVLAKAETAKPPPDIHGRLTWLRRIITELSRRVQWLDLRWCQ
jgi:hypothetical protein